MTIKQAMQAARLANEIKILDNEIKHMQKYAQILANNECAVALNIAMIQVGAETVEEHQPEIVAFMGMPMQVVHAANGATMMQPCDPSMLQPKQPPVEEYFQQMNSNEALMIFQTLLNLKLERRKELVNKINKIKIAN